MQSAGALQHPEALILWVIHWPSNGTIHDGMYVNGFFDYICRKLTQSDVHLVFDRQYDYSIKSGTRSNLAGEEATRQCQVPLCLINLKVILTVNENKIQVIYIRCKQLLGRVK